jgi:hypothetical protein
MAMWTGLGDNTELFWAVLSQKVPDSLYWPTVPSALAFWLETDKSTCMKGIILASKAISTNVLQ